MYICDVQLKTYNESIQWKYSLYTGNIASCKIRIVEHWYSDGIDIHNCIFQSRACHFHDKLYRINWHRSGQLHRVVPFSIQQKLLKSLRYYMWRQINWNDVMLHSNYEVVWRHLLPVNSPALKNVYFTWLEKVNLCKNQVSAQRWSFSLFSMKNIELKLNSYYKLTKIQH